MEGSSDTQAKVTRKVEQGDEGAGSSGGVSGTAPSSPLNREDLGNSSSGSKANFTSVAGGARLQPESNGADALPKP